MSFVSGAQGETLSFKDDLDRRQANAIRRMKEWDKANDTERKHIMEEHGRALDREAGGALWFALIVGAVVVALAAIR